MTTKNQNFFRRYFLSVDGKPVDFSSSQWHELTWHAPNTTRIRQAARHTKAQQQCNCGTSITPVRSSPWRSNSSDKLGRTHKRPYCVHVCVCVLQLNMSKHVWTTKDKKIQKTLKRVCRCCRRCCSLFYWLLNSWRDQDERDKRITESLQRTDQRSITDISAGVHLSGG